MNGYVIQSIFQVLIFITICLPTCTLGISDSQKYPELGRKLVAAFDEYIATEIERIKALKDYSNLVHQHLISQSSQVDLSNPIHAFMIMRKLSKVWDELKTKTTSKALEQLSSKIELLGLPNENDLTEIMEAIIRLQEVYELPAKGLITGSLEVKKKYKKRILDAADCFALGEKALAEGQPRIARDWLLQSAQLLGNRAAEGGLHRADVLHLLSQAVFSAGVSKSRWLAQQALWLNSTHSAALRSLRQLQQLGSVAKETPRDAAFRRYARLCRGDAAPPTTVVGVDVDKRRLVCRLRSPHAFFLLAPLQEEVACWRPFVAVWHGAIADAESRHIQRLAEPLLGPAGIVNRSDGSTQFSKTRVSRTAWLPPGHHPLVDRLSLRVQLMSGLSLASAEPWQINKYGFGGHYQPHHDFIPPPSPFGPERGNRIATLMLYLSDVPAGGATVFPDIGVSLRPSRGAAVFWYNLLQSGVGDPATLHAGCPVLRGTKWVANKWLHERHQEFRRPCGLSPRL